MLPPRVSELRILALRAGFHALEPIQFPDYPGSTMRGVFGRAFRSAVCIVRGTDCAACLLSSRCAYAVAFESFPPPEGPVMEGASRVPHPFVLAPPDGGFVPSGTGFSMGLTLIGRAVEQAPYHFLALETMGRFGFGKTRGRAHLEGIDFLLPDGSCRRVYDGATRRSNGIPSAPSLGDLVRPLPASPTRVTLSFLTPARLLEEGRPAAGLDFPAVLRAVVRRLCLLTGLYGAGREDFDRNPLQEAAGRVRMTASELRWHDWERWSARQGTRMKLGGYLGRISFEGDLAPFAPWLRAGSFVHVGKGSSFGLGKYECRFDVINDPLPRKDH